MDQDERATERVYPGEYSAAFFIIYHLIHFFIKNHYSPYFFTGNHECSGCSRRRSHGHSVERGAASRASFEALEEGPEQIQR